MKVSLRIEITETRRLSASNTKAAQTNITINQISPRCSGIQFRKLRPIWMGFNTA